MWHCSLFHKQLEFSGAQGRHAFAFWVELFSSLAGCVYYMSQLQRNEPSSFLKNSFNSILINISCKHVLNIGDLNQNSITRSVNNFLGTHGLASHVKFPTHMSGSSLDPIITDLDPSAVICRAGGAGGVSDHYAIISSISMSAMRDDSIKRTQWSCEDAYSPKDSAGD